MTSLGKPLKDSGSYMHHMSEQEILRILHSQYMCCIRLLEQIAITCEEGTEFLRTYCVEFLSREFVYLL